MTVGIRNRKPTEDRARGLELLDEYIKRKLDDAVRSLGGNEKVDRLWRARQRRKPAPGTKVIGLVGAEESLLERAKRLEAAAAEAQRAKVQGALDAARAVYDAAHAAYKKTKDVAWHLVAAGASATIGAVVLPVALLYLAATSKTGKDNLPLLLAGAWTLLTRTPPP